MKEFRHRANGIEFECRESGSGPLLLMAGGFRFTMDLWPPKLIDCLSGHFRLVQFNLRGVAGSGDDAVEHSIALYADDIAALAQSLSREKAVVFGWSMGSYAAQEALIRHPEVFSHAVLSCTNCGGEEFIPAEEDVYKQLTRPSKSPEEAAESMFQLLFGNDWLTQNRWLYREFPRPKTFCNESNARKQDRAITDWPGTYKRLPEIKTPVLIVNGEKDIINPKGNGILMQKQLPHSELVQISDGGHGLLYQYPEKVANFVADFIGRD